LIQSQGERISCC